jgi:hypothetical protein
VRESDGLLAVDGAHDGEAERLQEIGIEAEELFFILCQNDGACGHRSGLSAAMETKAGATRKSWFRKS